jgi:hypothetical protein
MIMSAIRKIGTIDGIIPTQAELKIVSGIYQYTKDIIERLNEGDEKLLADPEWLEHFDYEVQYLLDLCAKLEGSVIYWSVYDPLTHVYLRTIERVRSFPKASYIDNLIDFCGGLKQRFGEEINFPGKMIERRNKVLEFSENEPLKIKIWGNKIAWIYKGFYYYTEGHFSDQQISRLILEECDQENEYFEGLEKKYDNSEHEQGDAYYRQEIPEKVRIEVWWRDGGKCVRCGSGENLEYDHIIPISDGGSNATRNIELLCEKCYRSKHDQLTE